MIREPLRGIIPAIASPCDHNDVFLEDQFASLATYLYQNGVHGLYVAGGTGDCNRMRMDERKRATEIAVGVSKDYNGKVIAHVGSQGSREAVALAEHAGGIGADAVASMPPGNCTHAQLVSYYTDIARAAQIPVLIYYIPALTNRTFTFSEMLELLDIDGVVGFKFSDYDLFFMRQILQARPDVSVFNGEDQILMLALIYQASGGIGMYYNLFPQLFVQVYNSVKNGDVSRALELQDLLTAFFGVAFRYGTRETLEVILRRRGFGPYCFRKPHITLSDAQLFDMEEELAPKIAAIEMAGA